MQIARIFQPISLASGQSIFLDQQASHHLSRVLRAKCHDALIIFNGDGNEYPAVITDITKKHVVVEINQVILRETESPLALWLVQGISRGEKMDYTVQKAVELGVKKIIPLFTERCTVKLNLERSEKRLMHWQSIVISACEQSGRNRIPDIVMPMEWTDGLKNLQSAQCFVLSPISGCKLKELSPTTKQPIVLLIGPEGGLSERELREAQEQGFSPLNLGPRILRTETAAVAAITALQCFFGDMG